ncbi:(Na+)-NQR maturation NqrM [Nitrincola alkalilacustris]|uniref:(Na+)-NQR maturation NqrM n=1 Tax=Nitrincola alkalilacustris TaxID=1571224 RepID=UPI00124CE554|nr:(Na+)-NQR maturation NqrM [Nitrincola alkalilacustris]
MEVMILTFVVLTLLVVGMSVGVMMGRKPIAGSCGGMSAVGMDTACDICHGDKDICDEEQEKNKSMREDASHELAYEAKAKR